MPTAQTRRRYAACSDPRTAVSPLLRCRSAEIARMMQFAAVPAPPGRARSIEGRKRFAVAGVRPLVLRQSLRVQYTEGTASRSRREVPKIAAGVLQPSLCSGVSQCPAARHGNASERRLYRQAYRYVRYGRQRSGGGAARAAFRSSSAARNAARVKGTVAADAARVRAHYECQQRNTWQRVGRRRNNGEATNR